MVPKKVWGGPNLLERFHVCPLLLREKMEPPDSIRSTRDSSSTRPVYRYIFSCPGQAQALVRETPYYLRHYCIYLQILTIILQI